MKHGEVLSRVAGAAACLFLQHSLAAALNGGATSATNSIVVTIRVDASKTRGALKRIWRFFGADEPNYAYMKQGKKLLGELGELAPREVYFRAHNLLSSGDGSPA